METMKNINAQTNIVKPPHLVNSIYEFIVAKNSGFIFKANLIDCVRNSTKVLCVGNFTKHAKMAQAKNCVLVKNGI